MERQVKLLVTIKISKLFLLIFFEEIIENEVFDMVMAVSNNNTQQYNFT